MKITDKNILDYIKQFKYKEEVLITCDECEKDFYRVKKDIRDSITKKINNCFCSKECFSKYQLQGVLYNCKTCNKEIYRTKCQIENNIFCSHTCSASYNNKYRKNEKRIFSEQAKENIRLARHHYFDKLKKEYNLSPVLCEYCKNALTYKNKKRKYCCNGCKFKSKRKLNFTKKYIPKINTCKGRDCLTNRERSLWSFKPEMN